MSDATAWWLTFLPLFIAVALLGGVSAVVALLARSALRRMARMHVEPSSDPVRQARRIFGVCALIAWACLSVGLLVSLSSLTTVLWPQIVLLAVMVAATVWVVVRARPYLTTQAAPPAPTPAAPIPAAPTPAAGSPAARSSAAKPGGAPRPAPPRKPKVPARKDRRPAR
jgi:hypothetical protein